MKSRELTEYEKLMIKKLQKIAKKWPNGLQLFSWSGSFVVTDLKTGQIFDYISGISNDGGDPDFKEIDGIDYIDR